MLRNSFALALVAAAVVQPDVGAADHVPDNLLQDIDPNYIGCLMAVDDAKIEFLDALQIKCLDRMASTCRGDETSLPSQVIDCIYFETNRGVGFLQAAVAALPESVESGGFFGISYQRRRDGILEDVQIFKTSPKPDSIDIALRQGATIAVSAILLFYLARETGTPLEGLVAATFGDH